MKNWTKRKNKRLSQLSLSNKDYLKNNIFSSIDNEYRRETCHYFPSQLWAIRISDPNENERSPCFVASEEITFDLPPFGITLAFPIQDHLVLAPSDGQKVSVLLSRPTVGGCKRQRVEDEIYVDVLTPHIPRRFLYSSSRALSNAFRAASALFKSIASHSINWFSNI